MAHPRALPPLVLGPLVLPWRPVYPGRAMPTEPPPSTTLGMTQLAQTWTRRLEQVTLGLPHDALVVLRGPAELVGQRYELDRQAGVICLRRGDPAVEQVRRPGEPILLPSGYVSDPHAELKVEPRGWRIKDLGSSNHTYVGTVRVDEQRLVYGDELLLGDVALVFVPAERGAVPPHVLDRASGLLSPRVFTAEAARFTPGDGEADVGLLLLRVEGLRELLDASPERSRDPALVRRLGDALLALFVDDVVLGRLGTELFAVAFKSTTRAALRESARQVFAMAARLLEPRGLSARCAVSARRGHDARFTGLLSCALAALAAPHAAAAGGVIEAELEVHGALLADAELLAALSASPELPLLVLYIEDEDGLRHRVGHDRLGAVRWQLRRLAALATAEAWGAVEVCHLGVLDDRLFVLALADAGGSGALVDALRERFADLLERTLGPEAAWHRLGSVLIPADGRRHKGRALRRELLESAARAAGEGLGAGQRRSAGALPAPVAAPYGLIWVVTSHTARVKTILDAAEVALRFVTAAALSAVVSRSTDHAALRGDLQLRPGRGLALGEWVALLRRVAPHLGALADGDPLAHALGRAIGLGKRGPRLCSLLERRLLPCRNRFAHGDTAPRESRSAEQVQALLAELNEVIDCLAPLRELQLLTLLESTPRRAGGARATIRALSGARENFEVRQVDLRSRRQELFPGSTYLASSDYRHLLELAPLVTLSLCPRCEREEIFIADGLAAVGQTLRLSAVTTGHRLSLALDEELVPEGLGATLAQH